MFVVWRWRHERLQGEVTGLRLLVDHLEKLVEFERSRAHQPLFSHAAEVLDQPPVEPDLLPSAVSRAINASSRAGSDVHAQLTEAAHASLKDGTDSKTVASEIAVGARFDSLLKNG